MGLRPVFTMVKTRVAAHPAQVLPRTGSHPASPESGRSDGVADELTADGFTLVKRRKRRESKAAAAVRLVREGPTEAKTERKWTRRRDDTRKRDERIGKVTFASIVAAHDEEKVESPGPKLVTLAAKCAPRPHPDDWLQRTKRQKNNWRRNERRRVANSVQGGSKVASASVVEGKSIAQATRVSKQETRKTQPKRRAYGRGGRSGGGAQRELGAHEPATPPKGRSANGVAPRGRGRRGGRGRGVAGGNTHNHTTQPQADRRRANHRGRGGKGVMPVVAAERAEAAASAKRVKAKRRQGQVKTARAAIPVPATLPRALTKIQRNVVMRKEWEALGGSLEMIRSGIVEETPKAGDVAGKMSHMREHARRSAADLSVKTADAWSAGEIPLPALPHNLEAFMELVPTGVQLVRSSMMHCSTLPALMFVSLHVAIRRLPLGSRVVTYGCHPTWGKFHHKHVLDGAWSVSGSGSGDSCECLDPHCEHEPKGAVAIVGPGYEGNWHKLARKYTRVAFLYAHHDIIKVAKAGRGAWVAVGSDSQMFVANSAYWLRGKTKDFLRRDTIESHAALRIAWTGKKHLPSWASTAYWLRAASTASGLVDGLLCQSVGQPKRMLPLPHTCALFQDAGSTIVNHLVAAVKRRLPHQVLLGMVWGERTVEVNGVDVAVSLADSIEMVAMGRGNDELTLKLQERSAVRYIESGDHTLFSNPASTAVAAIEAARRRAIMRDLHWSGVRLFTNMIPTPGSLLLWGPIMCGVGLVSGCMLTLTVAPVDGCREAWYRNVQATGSNLLVSAATFAAHTALSLLHVGVGLTASLVAFIRAAGPPPSASPVEPTTVLECATTSVIQEMLRWVAPVPTTLLLLLTETYQNRDSPWWAYAPVASLHVVWMLCPFGIAALSHITYNVWATNWKVQIRNPHCQDDIQIPLY